MNAIKLAAMLATNAMALAAPAAAASMKFTCDLFYSTDTQMKHSFKSAMFNSQYIELFGIQINYLIYFQFLMDGWMLFANVCCLLFLSV